jgi:hypothetical protein
MSHSLLYSSGSAGITDATTRYMPVVGDLIGNALENHVELPIRRAGTVSNLRVYVQTNTVSVNSVITLRRNRAATALTVTYGPDEILEKKDLVNSVHVDAGDEIDYEIVVPSETGSNTITLRSMSVQFTPDVVTDCVSILAFNGVGKSISIASEELVYTPCEGQNSSLGVASETNVKYRARAIFSVPNLFVNVSSNARTTDTIFRNRKNGINGDEFVTFGSGISGQLEDDGSDVLAVGDDFNFYSVTGTGTGTMTLRTIAATFVNTSRTFVLLTGDILGYAGLTAGAEQWYGLGGRLVSAGSEVRAQVAPFFSFKVKELAVRVTVNTITTGSATYTLMDDSSDTALAVSFGIAETGLKLDSVDSILITSGESLFSIHAINTDAVGGPTVTWIGILGEGYNTSPVQLWEDLEVRPPASVAY